MSSSQKIRAHLRANVVGYVAVFIALTMTPALAAQIAPRNSVVSKSIKDGQVKSPDVAANGLTGSDINESTLQGLPGPADGSIGEVKLGFDPATQGELDTFATALSSAGTINDAGNPLAWSRLRGVPAGIADGQDAGADLIANGGLQYNGANQLGFKPCNENAPAVMTFIASNWQCVTHPNDGTVTTATPTPSVSGVDVLTIGWGPLTVLTNLTGGGRGRMVTLMVANSNTVSIDGDSNADFFEVAGDWNPNQRDTITFVWVAGSWLEVSRSANQ